ncbi:hemolysin family protein [Selenomonas sp. TAMA-11512]|uniref:hemolysin family protein n=1 Tax=Selenomonas sp. TAMA-11512 TaxID=3095337 RepID=UPI00308974ED|nr:hemolysin family protein [Selenomonas sp. TAMA-11512]
MDDPLLLIGKLFLVALLVFGNAFFVAAEFSIVKMRDSRIDLLISQGNRRAVYAKELIDHIDVALSVTQLGITIVSLGLGWLGEPVVANLLRPIFQWTGLPEALSHTVAFVLAFSIITALHIVAGELIPKNIAIHKVESVVLTISLPLLIFQRVMYPFVWALNSFANKAASWIGVEVAGHEEDVAHTEDEIRILMEESHKQGFIDKTELDFVDNVFDFADMSVREIMIPRTEMVCLYLEDPLEESIRTAMQEQMTRYPICDEDKDNIIGFLHIKDFLQNIYKHRPINLEKMARRALVVPEVMAVSHLLKMMQQERSQLAIVVDEYGGTSGMVTIEDIVEEIVGDIQDEFDEDRPLVEQRNEKLFSVDGKMLLEELEDILEVDIPEEKIDSVGGWLSAQVENPVRVGQKASYEGTEFFVEEIAGVRITRVLVQLKKPLLEKHEEIVDIAMKRRMESQRHEENKKKVEAAKRAAAERYKDR